MQFRKFLYNHAEAAFLDLHPSDIWGLVEWLQLHKRSNVFSQSRRDFELGIAVTLIADVALAICCREARIHAVGVHLVVSGSGGFTTAKTDNGISAIIGGQSFISHFGILQASLRLFSSYVFHGSLFSTTCYEWCLSVTISRSFSFPARLAFF